MDFVITVDKARTHIASELTQSFVNNERCIYTALIILCIVQYVSLQHSIIRTACVQVLKLQLTEGYCYPYR
jgi:hypothetical protein